MFDHPPDLKCIQLYIVDLNDVKIKVDTGM